MRKSDAEYARKWRETHPNYTRVKSEVTKRKDAVRFREWRKNNRARMKQLSAERYARKKRRIPDWLTDDQKHRIRSFYVDAQKLTELFGTKMHVDHIVPLCGHNVCGLHVPWNLQVMLARENQIKNAGF